MLLQHGPAQLEEQGWVIVRLVRWSWGTPWAPAFASVKNHCRVAEALSYQDSEQFAGLRSQRPAVAAHYIHPGLRLGSVVEQYTNSWWFPRLYLPMMWQALHINEKLCIFMGKNPPILRLLPLFVCVCMYLFYSFCQIFYIEKFLKKNKN